jgi:hypothetical protein
MTVLTIVTAKNTFSYQLLEIYLLFFPQLRVLA